VGKTHIATALTLAACRNGLNARFFSAAGIVNTYREARESKTVLRLEASLIRLDVIVTDERRLEPTFPSAATALLC